MDILLYIGRAKQLFAWLALRFEKAFAMIVLIIETFYFLGNTSSLLILLVRRGSLGEAANDYIKRPQRRPGFGYCGIQLQPVPAS